VGHQQPAGVVRDAERDHRAERRSDEDAVRDL
jgi:hypothetical protein